MTDTTNAEIKVTERFEEFDRIVRPIERQMMSTVWHILGDADAAEDALQNAMVVIVRKWRRVASHANPAALIIKICADSAYDEARRKLRKSGGTVVLESIAEPANRDLATTSLADDELRAEIMTAITKLPRNQSIAFMMRIVEEHDYEFVATSLGCSVVTARKHVARARARLANLLGNLALEKDLNND